MFNNNHLGNQDRKLEKCLRVIPIQRDNRRNVSSRTITSRQTKWEIQSKDSSQVRASLFLATTISRYFNNVRARRNLYCLSRIIPAVTRRNWHDFSWKCIGSSQRHPRHRAALPLPVITADTKTLEYHTLSSLEPARSNISPLPLSLSLFFLFTFPRDVQQVSRWRRRQYTMKIVCNDLPKESSLQVLSRTFSSESSVYSFDLLIFAENFQLVSTISKRQISSNFRNFLTNGRCM